MPVKLDRLVEIAKIQSTEASNKIEGIVTTSTRMKQLFEERVGLMSDTGNGSTAYDIVKKYTEEKVGKFTGAEVVVHCPSIGRSSALAALKRLPLCLLYDVSESPFTKYENSDQVHEQQPLRMAWKYH